MLKEIIDEYYAKRQWEKEQTRFYITDAGKCPRSVFFKFKRAPKEEMEPRVLRMFEHGDYIHRLILNTLFSAGLVRSSEISIPPQAIISGRADAIVSLGEELYVLDIKSMNSLVFKNLDQPKEENINQIQLYLHFFKIPKGILLYVNKDTQELKEFIIDYDETSAKKLLADLENLKTKIDSDIVPPRLESWPEDWQCQYCAFKEICSLGASGEMNWNDFKTKLEALNSQTEINSKI